MNKIAPSVSYEKSRIALRAWLSGRSYHKALEAMSIAETYHRGLRKDGQPEFSHHVAQAHLMTALEPHLREPEMTFIALFLHDTVEDYGTPADAAPLPAFTLKDVYLKFGPRAASAVDRLSKVVDGRKKPTDVYFAELARDPVASLVKGTDRIHNHQTMHGGFTAAKRDSYLDETETHILPMLKAARRNFPDQLQAYELLKLFLHSQMGLIRAMEPVGVPAPADEVSPEM